MPTNTNNMGLKIPNAGETNYPTSVSDSFTSIDAHDHSSGKGTQIVSGGIADSAVTTAKIGALAVTTAKIAANAVTRAKLESVGQQASSSRGSPFVLSSVTRTDVTGVTCSITTTGRPVIVGIKRDGDSGGYGISYETANSISSFEVLILRGTDVVFRDLIPIDQNYSGSASGVATVGLPAAFAVLDAVAAGTYTYKLQVACTDASDTLIVAQNVNIYAYEL
jgi:hypothetical protein